MDVEWCEMWTVAVRCGICCALRCGGVKWWWDAGCGVMRCGIWCGVKCAVMLNVGVVWNSCGRGMV